MHNLYLIFHEYAHPDNPPPLSGVDMGGDVGGQIQVQNHFSYAMIYH